MEHKRGSKPKPKKDHCRRCGGKITVMAFRGTDYCCNDCLKGRPKGSTRAGLADK